MSRDAPKRTRPPVKQAAIAQALREQIITGELSPGTRLPPQSKLERRFRVAGNTLQRALNRLAEEGFIYTNSTVGTFVAEHPPHVRDIGVVLPSVSGRQGRDRFNQAFAAEAERHDRHAAPARRYVPWPMHKEQPIDRQRGELEQWLRDRRLAGLIFAGAPGALVDVAVTGPVRVPCVAVNCAPPGEGVPRVMFDHHALLTRAVAALAGRGRRRVALLTAPRPKQQFDDAWRRIVKAHGMTTGPELMHGIAVHQPAEAEAITRLLMHVAPEHRPDAIVVTNDNMLEHAAAGLLAAGARIPEDIEVVAHCNFPWPTPTAVPIHRLGFDAAQVFETCIDLVDRQCAGQDVPSLTRIEPVFEHELQHMTDQHFDTDETFAP